MKTTLKTLLTAAIVLTYSASIAQQDLKFDKIRVAGGASVELRQADRYSIMMKSDSTPAPGSMFNITPDGWLTVNGRAGDDIELTAPMISEVQIAGSGALDMDDTFKMENLKIIVSGVGKIDMKVEAKNIHTTISGAGKVELSGVADDHLIEISGSGKVDAEELKVKSCTANISGSGKCLVNVSDVLNANISGSGNVYYVKTPAVVNRNITGIGKVGDANVNVQDTTKVMLGKTKVLIVDEKGKSPRHGFKEMLDGGPDKVKSHWAGFELGVNMLMDEDFKTDAPQNYEFLDLKLNKSIAVNLNLYDLEMKLYRRNIMLITGLGLTINNYRFKSAETLIPSSDSVVTLLDPSVNIKKNKLVATYLTIPLLLEFNTSENPKKTFHIAMGVIGGLRIGSHLKVVKEVKGDENKVKYRDDFNLNPWRYDATVRLGYRNFTVFGSYNMAGLFKDNKGPELNTFTAGIRLAGW